MGYSMDRNCTMPATEPAGVMAQKCKLTALIYLMSFKGTTQEPDVPLQRSALTLLPCFVWP